MITRYDPDTDQLLTSSTRAAVSAKELERARIEALTREFEQQRGPIVTLPIVPRDVPARISKATTPEPKREDTLLTPDEAAELLGVTSSWVYRNHAAGTGPQSIKQGRYLKFKRTELERYKAAHPDINAASRASRKRYGRQFVINASTDKQLQVKP